LSQDYEREDTLSCIGVPLVVLARQIFAYSAQSSRGPAERKPVLVVRQIRANKTIRLLLNISSNFLQLYLNFKEKNIHYDRPDCELTVEVLSYNYK
jgi:hypothetical protein